MMNRRDFFTAIGAPAAAAALDPDRAHALLSTIAAWPGAPDAAAQDEELWFQVQQAFTVDRSIVNLNSGGVSPAPRAVQTAMNRHLDFQNACPAYNMWTVLEPQLETVRKAMAGQFGCDPEEIAFTRNSSEALQICQLGIDLKPGDEMLATDQDYGRMLNTFKQREKREGLVLKTFPIPVPCEDPGEIVRLYEKNLTAKTRVLIMSHMINLTGQILPVREVARLARAKGIPLIVDGAHSFAHFPFKRDDLECDFFAASLHKWLFAPIGTGLLYVRSNRIESTWPLMAAAEEQRGNIRKFEEIGTHPAANHNAIGEALAFHQGLGAERKSARLRYLRDRWVRRLTAHKKVKLFTSLKPQFSCGIATFAVEGLDPAKIRDYLWEKHRILVIAIGHKDIPGVRVSPSVWSTIEEVDRFADVVEQIVLKGLP